MESVAKSVGCFALAILVAISAVQSGPVPLRHTNGVVGNTRDFEEYVTDEGAQHIEDAGPILPDPIYIGTVSFRPQPTNPVVPSSSTSAAASSLPELAEDQTAGGRMADNDSRPKCAKAPRVKRISLPGCSDLYVDIGQCSGACNTRQQPQDRFEIVNGVYQFPVKRSCKCCQTKATEIQEVRTRCAYPNMPGTFYYRKINVEVITKCHCRKCVMVQPPEN